MCSVLRLDAPDAILDNAFFEVETASKNVDKLYDAFVESINGRKVRLGSCNMENLRKSIALMETLANKISFVNFPSICLSAHLNVLSASQIMLESFKLNQKMTLEYKMNTQRVILKFSGKNILNEELSKTFENVLKENNIDLNNYKIICKSKPRKKVQKTPKKTVQVQKAPKTINGSGFLARWLS